MRDERSTFDIYTVELIQKVSTDTNRQYLLTLIRTI